MRGDGPEARLARVYRHPDTRILVFTKAPEPGRVKTRLIPALGPQGAARLQRRLTCHLLSRLAEAALAPVQLWVMPDLDHPFIRALARRHGCSLHPQQGSDLGARMLAAAGQALGSAGGAGHPAVRAVILLGTDCPALDGDYLAATLSELAHADAVLGPAEDGGYVMLALRRVHPMLFADLPWGSERIAQLTRERLVSLGWRWSERPALPDIDRPEDLQRLPAGLAKRLRVLAT
ncbi:MAG: glycosyltransferase [Sphingobacteriia bacterium]|nr:glycosyltransferase [Sphingobacteriia bacterium]NCC38819.1 glycosyltransferase [Gammaproteobacteria bacterium]